MHIPTQVAPLTAKDVAQAIKSANTPVRLHKAVKAYLTGRDPNGRPMTTFQAAVIGNADERELQSALHTVMEVLDRAWLRMTL